MIVRVLYVKTEKLCPKVDGPLQAWDYGRIADVTCC